MNIVHFSASLDIGGLERMVLSLATEQRHHGHSVAIGCLYGDGPVAEHARRAGFTVFNCHKRSGLDWAAIRTIRRALRGARADVLHTHNEVAHYYATAASLGAGVRRVVNTRHNMGTERVSRQREFLYRLAMRATDRAVSVCHAAQRGYVASGSIPAAKALTIVNGVELARFSARNGDARARLLTQTGLAHDAVQWINVGRLSEVKCHPLMFTALKRCREQGVPVQLTIVGDGESRASLQTLCDQMQLAEHIRFLGTREDIPELLAGADAFIQSSSTEGYSLALVEASCAGLPILATAVGGNAEIVTAGVSGLLVPANDADALAQGLVRLSRETELRAKMGLAARQWALKNAGLQTMYERYQQLYEETN